MRQVAYLTDVEGRWDKLVDFCAGNPLVRLDDAGALHLADGAALVFGGDVCDRGPASLRLVDCLLAARRAHPGRVVLLAGNRDINKLRLVRELDGRPPARTPPAIAAGPRAELLRFVLAETMGARQAFEHRRAELAATGRPTGDDDVVDSFLAEVAPRGPLTRYLAEATLAHREGETLFVHGGVTAENLGVVPGRADRAPDVDAWVRALADFLGESVAAFAAARCDAAGAPGWDALVAYQAPRPGTKLNQESVVYGRPLDDRGDPVLPPAHVVRALRASGIRRVVVGHTPSGDCPALLRDEDGFELVLADNSYGRIERGARVVIDGDVLRVDGLTALDSGEHAAVRWARAPGDASPLGLRDAATRRLIKARLARGDYLGFRPLDGFAVEQVALGEAELAAAALVVPR